MSKAKKIDWDKYFSGLKSQWEKDNPNTPAYPESKSSTAANTSAVQSPAPASTTPGSSSTIKGMLNPDSGNADFSDSTTATNYAKSREEQRNQKFVRPAVGGEPYTGVADPDIAARNKERVANLMANVDQKIPMFQEQNINAKMPDKIQFTPDVLKAYKDTYSRQQSAPGQESYNADESGKLGAVLSILQNISTKPVERVTKPIAEGLGQIGEGLSQYNGVYDPQSLRGIGNVLGGTIKAALGALPPVMALNAIQEPLMQASSDIGEKLGIPKEKTDAVTSRLIPFVFGLPVGIGSLASEEATKLIEKTGAFNKLSDKDKKIALDLIQNGLFFGLAAKGEGIAEKGKSLLEDHPTENLQFPGASRPLSMGGHQRTIQQMLSNDNREQGAEREGQLKGTDRNIDPRRQEENAINKYLSEQPGQTAGRVKQKQTAKDIAKRQESELRKGTPVQPDMDELITLFKKSYDDNTAQKLAVNLTRDEAKYLLSGGREGKEPTQKRIDGIIKGGSNEGPETRTEPGKQPDGRTGSTAEQPGSKESKATVKEEIKKDEKAPDDKSDARGEISPNNKSAILRLTKGGRKPEAIAKALKIPVEDVNSVISGNTKIKSPAIRTESGEIIQGGPNHAAIIEKNPEAESGQKGFVTTDGDFVNRKEGAEIANTAGQTETKTNNLHSEELKDLPGEEAKAEDDTKKKTSSVADEHFKKEQETYDRNAAAIDEHAKTNDVIDLKDKDGFRYVMAKSTKEPGKWQITEFSYKGEPNSDRTFDTKAEAIEEMKRANGEIQKPADPATKSEIPTGSKEPEKVSSNDTANSKKSKGNTEKKASGFIRPDVGKIGTQKADFQGRNADYSEQTYNRIVNEVENGEFNESSLPPIQVWKNPKNGQLITLNHSRLAAYKDLASGKVKDPITGEYRDAKFHKRFTKNDFNSINAQVVEAKNIEEARKIAQESNSGAKQTDTENAKYFRGVREGSKTKTDYEKKAKDLYDSDWKYIDRLSRLNPDGKLLSSLKLSEKSTDKQMKSTLQKAADWVGEVRKQNPHEITDLHEEEIYDWLTKGGGQKITKSADLTDRISNIVNNFGFDKDQALNLEHRASKGANQTAIDNEIADVRTSIRSLEAERDSKTAVPSESRLNKISEEIKYHNKELSKLMQQRGDAIAEDNNQADLFGSIDKEIKKEGIDERRVEGIIEDTGGKGERGASIETIAAQAQSEKESDLVKAVKESERILGIEPTEVKFSEVTLKKIVPTPTKLEEKADHVAISFKTPEARLSAHRRLEKAGYTVNALGANDLRVEKPNPSLLASESKKYTVKVDDNIPDRIKVGGIERPTSGNKGEFNPSERNMLAEERKAYKVDKILDQIPAEPFYSKLERTLEQKAPGKNIESKSLLAMLKNNGVKDGEIKWMDIEGFLKDNPKATKAELMDYVRANKIEVKETTRADKESLGFRLNEDNAAKDLRETGFYNVDENHWIETRPDLDYEVHYLENGKPKEKIISTLREASEIFYRGHDNTKYSNYTTPGGKNYREILFQMPEKPIQDEYLRLVDRIDNLLEKQKSTRGLSESETSELYEKLRLQNTKYKNEKTRGLSKRLDAARAKTGAPYKSSHWEEPGVFAHTRVNDRTINGKKYLHIEEVQSDQAREGREKGYATKPVFPDALDIIKGENGYAIVYKDNGDQVPGSGIYESKDLALKDWEKWPSTMGKQGVPDFPFKNNWQEFIMKRMLRHAAENGYDGISWATGEQTADRYDLSKEIGRVKYEENRQFLTAYNKDGGEVISKSNVPPEELENYVGKDVAKKLMGQPTVPKFGPEKLKVAKRDNRWTVNFVKDNGELGQIYKFARTKTEALELMNKSGDLDNYRELSGLDLKTGGEWAKNLYDKQLVNFMDSYAKKWGAKAEDGDIHNYTPQELRQIENGETYGGKTTKELKAENVHSIAITPEMKNSVMNEGQPLFQKGEKYEASQSNLKPLQEYKKHLELSIEQMQKKLDEGKGRDSYDNSPLFKPETRSFERNSNATPKALKSMVSDYYGKIAAARKELDNTNRAIDKLERERRSVEVDKNQGDMFGGPKKDIEPKPMFTPDPKGETKKIRVNQLSLFEKGGKFKKNEAQIKLEFGGLDAIRKTVQSIRGAIQSARLYLRGPEDSLQSYRETYQKGIDIPKRTIPPGIQQITQKDIKFIGLEIRKGSEAQDIGDYAYVIRHPGVETYLAIGHDNNGVITGNVLLSSGASNYIHMGKGDFELVSESLKSRGATKVTIIHNHPSGDPEPSMRDLIGARSHKAEFASYGLELQHVAVVNGKRFTHWEPTDNPEELIHYGNYKNPQEHPYQSWYDGFDKAPKIEITDSKAPEIFKSVLQGKGKVAIIATDSYNRIRGFEFEDSALLKNSKAFGERVDQILKDQSGAKYFIVGNREDIPMKRGTINEHGLYEFYDKNDIISKFSQEPYMASISYDKNNDAMQVVQFGNRTDFKNANTLFESGESYRADQKQLRPNTSSVNLRSEQAEPAKPKQTDASEAPAQVTAAGLKNFKASKKQELVKKQQRPERPPVDLRAEPGAKEALKKATTTLQRGIGGITKMFAPMIRGEEASTTAAVTRENAARLAHKRELMHEAVKDIGKHFDKQDPYYNMDLIDGAERNSYRGTKEEQDALRSMQKILSDKYKFIQNTKNGESSFIENYFPHIWKDPEKAKEVLGRVYSKRPLEGTRGFQKQRTIPFTVDGLALGLEPVSTNPVELFLAKNHEMDKYIMAHDIFNDLKERGLVKYHRIGDQPEAGWTKLNDRIGTAFGNPNIGVSEAFDSKIMQGLNDVAKNLEINTERKTSIGGKRWGYADTGGDITTKFGGPESVLAHEIGHQLDYKYGLKDQLVNNPEFSKELRKLADLRYEGMDPEDSFKKYVRKGEEKMAVMLEAYIHAPEKFKEAAPNTYKFFTDFLKSKPELKPLLDVKPSLVLGTNSSTVNAGGMVIRGYYYMPEQAATILNNYLSPGLSGKIGYELLRKSENLMNQAQLGLSAFHAGFTTADVMVSKTALGIQKLSQGRIIEGTKDILSTPIAPVTNFIKGNQLLKSYYGKNPELSGMVDDIVKAGGKVRMDSFFKNNAVEGWLKAWRGGRYVSGVVRTPGAFIEAMAKPLMQELVPRQKLGVFYDLAKNIHDEATKKNWSDDLLRSRLQEAWDSVDNRMGQLVYDNLFWNKALKDLGMASVRSLGWNIGDIRELGGAPIDLARQLKSAATGEGFRVTPKMAYAISLPIITGMIGSITGALYGQPPKSIKDLYFPRTGRKNPDGTDERISLPTYMKDVYAYGMEAGQTVINKLNPMISTVIQMLQNKDYYGYEIRNESDPLVQQLKQEMTYIGTQFVPFSVRGAMQRNQAGSSLSEDAQSFVGLNPAPKYITNSRIQNKITENYQAEFGTGKKPYEAKEINQAKSDIMKSYKKGDAAEYKRKLEDAISKGLIEPNSQFIKRMGKNAKVNIDEMMFKRLSNERKQRLISEMSEEERAKYLPLTSKKFRASSKLDGVGGGTEAW